MSTALPRGSWLLIAAGAVCDLLGVAVATLWWLDPSHDRWDVTRLGLAFLLLALGMLLFVAAALWHVRRLATGRDTPASFLTPHDEHLVLEAIRSFEHRTSGEIRVHLAEHAPPEILEIAAQTFRTLGMEATEQRNGVLIYVATADRRVAILGDRGIDALVGADFWGQAVAATTALLAAGRHGEALAAGVTLAGDALARHFPPRADDRNELPDSISRED